MESEISGHVGPEEKLLRRLELERYTFVETLTDDVPDIKQIIWKPRRSSLELSWLPMDGLRLVDTRSYEIEFGIGLMPRGFPRPFGPPCI